MLLAGGISLYNYLDHHYGIHPVLQASVIALALLLLAGFIIQGQLKKANGGVLPDEGVTLRNLIELILDALVALSRDIMGPDWRKFFPVVGTIFFFILLSNLMGLIPGLGGASSYSECTFAWGFVSYIVYNIVGIKHHGWKYIYQFLGPSIFELEIGGKHYHIRLLAPIFFVLEVPLHFARAITLGIRLLANMFADHMVVAIFISLVPIGVPAIFLGLGMLIAFLQAFVFALLTMIYIGLALEDAH